MNVFSNRFMKLFLFILSYLIKSSVILAQSQSIPFDADHWQIFNGKIEAYQGRNSFAGTAALKDVVFENGVIEFDVSVTGQRSYPGLRFRNQSMANAENVYIRPHIIRESPDALQYTPVFNREACWQLYNGDGYTTGIDIPLNEWVHFKLEVSGSQARVYIGDTDTPSLKIDYLKHGISQGGIILTAPPDGSAHFSNFSIDTTRTFNFDAPLRESHPPGLITDWVISQPFKYTKIDLEKTPDQQGLTDLEWSKVSHETSGLVNVSKHVQRRGREPDFIFAKTTIPSDQPKQMALNFGYSDWIGVFMNGEMLFSGASPYRGRGPGFPGIIGFFDTVMLPLQKGDNELMLIVGESFGGWGFMCQDGDAMHLDSSMKKKWKTDDVFTTSESVLYDTKRDILYVTNFDQFNVGNPRIHQFISQVHLNGEIKELTWIDSLENPLGMTIHNDKLYVAERRAVAEIDLDNGKLIKRQPIPQSIFLNDITVDKAGLFYITDSNKNAIWRYADGQAEVWLSGDEVSDPNVIYFHDGKIFFGNSDDRSLKSVDPQTKEVNVIARFEEGFIDGFRPDKKGNYLVSLWHGVLYRVTPSGHLTKLIDTSVTSTYSADFEYIPEKGLLIIPTFYKNTIVAYELN